MKVGLGPGEDVASLASAVDFLMAVRSAAALWGLPTTNMSDCRTKDSVET